MEFFEKINLWQHVAPVMIILLSLVIGLAVRRTLLGRLSRWAEGTQAKLDDILIKTLRSVVVLWFVLIGIYISTLILPLNLRESNLLQKIFQSLLIFSIFWFLLKLLGEIFLTYSKVFQEKIPEATIVKNTVKFFILALGILIILQTLGIPITPIITTLGIGGLAIALAMQDTLANLFAGFHIIATKRVKKGDYIRLDSGEEGYVVDVTWRDTVLKQLPQNHVIIPNSKLSSAVVVNYHRPKKAMNVMVDVGVDYTSDLNKVEAVTLEVARDCLSRVEGGVEKFEPLVRFHTFDDSSINFTVYLRCHEFYQHIELRHEFIKKLKEHYDREGINIPFPIRTVYLKKD